VRRLRAAEVETLMAGEILGRRQRRVKYFAGGANEARDLRCVVEFRDAGALVGRWFRVPPAPGQSVKVGRARYDVLSVERGDPGAGRLTVARVVRREGGPAAVPRGR
jgi:hypothetical protein